MDEKLICPEPESNTTKNQQFARCAGKCWVLLGWGRWPLSGWRFYALRRPHCIRNRRGHQPKSLTVAAKLCRIALEKDLDDQATGANEAGCEFTLAHERL